MRNIGTAAFFLLYIFSIVYAVFDEQCVVPPLECPNKNISFWLYTRANQDNPVELKVDEPKTIKTAPWVKDAPVKILIHGYTGHREFSPNTEIRPAYMECCDYNIVSVDYHDVAEEPCYSQAARNVELVGMCTAQLIDVLVQNHHVPLVDFHVIGFSLGGQTAGFIANYLNSGKLERITALDPALPMFATADKAKKVGSEDARFVDVLHTNALEKGKLEACGHVDYYANGGMSQPGCRSTDNHTKSGCDHARAPLYYAESITSPKGFYATKCSSWITYMLGWCELMYTDEEIVFGEHASKNSSGTYFFSTNSDTPYARGSRKNARRLKRYINKIPK